MAAHELWTRARSKSPGVIEEQKAEIYRSGKRYKIRGVRFGNNGFDSRNAARKFLARREFARVDVGDLTMLAVKSIIMELECIKSKNSTMFYSPEDGEVVVRRDSDSGRWIVLLVCDDYVITTRPTREQATDAAKEWYQRRNELRNKFAHKEV